MVIILNTDKYKVEEDILLGDFLKQIKKNLSSKKIKQYLKYNNILVNDKVVNKGNLLLKKDDVVSISYGRKVINEFDIDIIYEDKDIIVINKPCGLLSISNSKENELTAFKLVREYVRRNNKNTFLFVIHRLDKETSGVLMFAKSEKIKHLFQDNWNDIVKKRGYIAVVEGIVKKDGRIESYLKENKMGMIYSSRGNDGKYAITEYKVVKSNNKYTLLDINILTGRRNQIRVHLSEMGNPIVGDSKYGNKSKSRLMLHAYLLELIDPRNKEMMSFKSNIPEEFYISVK